MSVRSSQPVNSAGGGESMFSLKWNQYQSHWTCGLSQLLNDEFSMTDITLGCEGQFVQAHKLALALCSPFFKEYFKTYNMDKTGGLIVLANVKFKDLKNLLRFIYQGEVNVSNAELNSFLRTANLLQIEGLMEGSGTGSDANTTVPSIPESKPATLPPPLMDSTSTGGSSSSSTSQGGAGPVSSGPGPAKRSRMSTPVHGQPASSAPVSNLNISAPSTTTSLNVPLVHTMGNSSAIHFDEHSEGYDPLGMDNEHDEEEEQMISMDEVKPEPIAIYTINDEDDDGSHPINRSEESLNHTYNSSQSQSQVPGSSTGNRSHSQLLPGSSTTMGQASQSTDYITKPTRNLPKILDGKYFKIVNVNLDVDGVPVCAMCLACDRVLKGRFDPNSNFVRHLKTFHPESFTEYSNDRKLRRR